MIAVCDCFPNRRIQEINVSVDFDVVCAAPEAHEASEISYCEQIYSARPAPLRPGTNAVVPADDRRAELPRSRR